jgi:ankyrin repeat protein
MDTPPATLDALIHAIHRGSVEEVQSIVVTTPSLIHQRDPTGATPLHHAAFLWRRPVVDLLLALNADINTPDTEYGATPAGWSIHFLRERGAFLAIELDDLAHAIERGDTHWTTRFLRRFPALRHARTTDGIPFRQLALQSGNAQLAQLFTDPEQA